jgi:hypothetical protein
MLVLFVFVSWQCLCSLLDRLARTTTGLTWPSLPLQGWVPFTAASGLPSLASRRRTGSRHDGPMSLFCGSVGLCFQLSRFVLSMKLSMMNMNYALSRQSQVFAVGSMSVLVTCIEASYNHFHNYWLRECFLSLLMSFILHLRVEMLRMHECIHRLEFPCFAKYC